ncbi:MAG: aminomethyl-transferring glycine dehydrogenase [Acidobacteria bacterium]|nr:aminomethyl-transferring glycine dehydrogenase [Acidobacteriota bacterium]
MGADPTDLATMLATVGAVDLDDLARQTVPEVIALTDGLSIDEGLSEQAALRTLRELASKNEVGRSAIGMGYYGTITPAVIQRNVLENPAWYTAYTPYQPEISQGRLEALLNYQTMVAELTGFDVANASLLDEATAAAEAMTMAHRASSVDSDVFFVVEDTLPQTLAVLHTRAEPLGIEIQVGPASDIAQAKPFGVLVSVPGLSGAVPTAESMRRIADDAHGVGALAIAAADLLALCLITPPGHLGFDAAIGTSQRFGVPMGMGGPHAAFLAIREQHVRSLPGRLVGVSVDTAGRPALRLALQTREQHIRREKATSNICTAQVLLANMAGLYAAWHGREGLVEIASRVHAYTTILAEALSSAGHEVLNDTWFDTLTVEPKGEADVIIRIARNEGWFLRHTSDDTVGIAIDETMTRDDIRTIAGFFGCADLIDKLWTDAHESPLDSLRTDAFLDHHAFRAHRTEHEMLRYLRGLADKDLALDRTMIPLGSCTMKLNATSEMIPVTWPEFASLHPFAPEETRAGSLEMITQLEDWLCEATGYDAVSLQPNAGSQGEFAGLLAIRAYHVSRGDTTRDVCLIPSSAHGTNAASAVMAGMKVAVVKCDDEGNVDVDDLRRNIELAGERLAALMITYPSTHGVYETAVVEICGMVHDAGGQVYVDGANLNALVGLAKPGKFGADVSHLNLHKTFCIPHGGGGPGVGPVAVREHLAAFLPAVIDFNTPQPDPTHRVGPVSAAPHGSAGILPIPWMYIAMMGGAGLRRATQRAILNANYIAARLGDAFPVLYRGKNGRVAHECILDLRPLGKSTGVTIDDVAKRLIDHGFHAPTVSFPVAGTLMVEPTESEEKAELDRFVDAMLAIRAEIADVEAGRSTIEDSPLRHAPHTVSDTVGDWTRSYDRTTGLYPLARTVGRSYFPPVSRIDAAAGDRNLVCSCTPLEEYAVAHGGS